MSLQQLIKKCHHFLILLLFLLGISSSLAWTNEEGLRYSHWRLKDKTSVHLLEVDPAFFDIIIDKAEKGKLQSVEAISRRNHAVAAINGGFFQMDGVRPDVPRGVLKILQTWYSIGSKLRGALGWSNDNSPVLFDWLRVSLLRGSKDTRNVLVAPQIDTSEENMKNWNAASYIIGGAPLLIREGKLVEDYSFEKVKESFVTKRHARTAVGFLANGHWLFMVVDGKKNLFFEGWGITLPNLAKLMLSLGCVDALNLDGGGSSTMVLYDEVVNTPSGEKPDKRGNRVRDVSDALLVIPKKS